MGYLRICAIAAALAALSAPAVAGQPHNVRLYSILDDTAKLTIDGVAQSDLPPNSVNFYYYAPGQHTFVLTDGNGDTVTLNADLEDGQMAASRGRSWWCVTTGRRTADHVLVLILDTEAQCQGMLAVAPDKDDPSDQPTGS
ncbi:MAG TPA: hypothetical protein VMU08_04315 [Rhizomicrobium sp.]|nr:hypothetical protein [Rhizomicrobium sp.]